MAVRVPVTKKMATTAAKIIVERLCTEKGTDLQGASLRYIQKWDGKWCREIYDLDHHDYSIGPKE